MEILDDQQLESNSAEQLKSPIFIKRIRFFSIITLIHSIVLFILSSLFLSFCFALNKLNIEEFVLLVYSSLFALLGGFLLFRTYYFTNQFIQKNQDLSNLNKGLKQFLYFWITLTFGFIIMIIYTLNAGF